MPLMRVVDRDGKEHEVEARAGLKVMENLRELDYGVAAICGGMCSCATCHIYVDADWMDRVPAPQSDERELLIGAVARAGQLAPVLPDRVHGGARGSARHHRRR